MYEEEIMMAGTIVGDTPGKLPNDPEMPEEGTPDDPEELEFEDDEEDYDFDEDDEDDEITR